MQRTGQKKRAKQVARNKKTNKGGLSTQKNIKRKQLAVLDLPDNQVKIKLKKNKFQTLSKTSQQNTKGLIKKESENLTVQ